MLRQCALILLAAVVPGGLCSRKQPAEARFWAWFRAHETALLEVVTAKEPICDELSAELQKVHPDLTFEFGPVESGRREFVLSAGGIRAAFPAVLALARAAPSLPRWTIIRFRPARPDSSTVNFGGLGLDARSVEFLAEPDGTGTGLTISVPGYKVTPNKTYEQCVYLLLDRMLGEYSVEMGVGFIKIIAPEGRPIGQWRPLTRVGDAVKTQPTQ